MELVAGNLEGHLILSNVRLALLLGEKFLNSLGANMTVRKVSLESLHATSRLPMQTGAAWSCKASNRLIRVARAWAVSSTMS